MKQIATLLCLVLLLTSCIYTKPDFSSTVLTCTDATGSVVSVPEKPAKVAVLFSSLADIWKSAGGEVYATVGESVERGFASDNAILVDGGAGKSIDRETLVAARPDLVICSADVPAQLDTALFCKSVGIPAIALRVESFADYLNTLKLFTTILGTPENYTVYGENIEKDVEDFKNFKFDEPILFIRTGSSARSAKAKTASEHFAAAILKDLGTHNIAEDAPVLLDGISIEEIIVKDPKHIFVSTMGDENAAKEYFSSLIQSSEWASLSAVKSGNVHYLPKELFQYKPNSRWGEAYAYLIKILEGES